MTNMMPIDALETHAAGQRKQLHNDIEQLRSSLRETRNTLEPKKVVREYLGAASGIAALAALVLGYSLAGIFTREYE